MLNKNLTGFMQSPSQSTNERKALLVKCPAVIYGHENTFLRTMKTHLSVGHSHEIEQKRMLFYSRLEIYLFCLGDLFTNITNQLIK